MHAGYIPRGAREFCHNTRNNNRGIGENGSDLPDELLTQLYNSIHANEIIIEQREHIKSVREGWLGKQGGRVKTWKKRYVILSGNVMYYFKSPKDKAPAGFLPLENIQVKPDPRAMTFELHAAAGHTLKSVRMATDKKNQGGFEQGHHKSFNFKANSPEDLDLWVPHLCLTLDEKGCLFPHRDFLQPVPGQVDPGRVHN